MLLEPAPRTIRGARNLLSVALQYGNAFGQGFQAAALKPADFFGNDDVLYLMEDMATGEIRLSILWEWLHKGARLTEDDPETGLAGGRRLQPRDLSTGCSTRSTTSCSRPSNRDVHDDSKTTTLPIAREIVETYVADRDQGALVHRSAEHQPQQPRSGRGSASGSRAYMNAFTKDGTRITENLDTARRSSCDEVTALRQRGRARLTQWMDGPRFAGITRLYSRPPGRRAAGHDRPGLHRRADAPRRTSTPGCASSSPPASRSPPSAPTPRARRWR